MGYAATWRVLESIAAEFRGKGVAIPLGIIEDLRSARATIRMMKSGASNEEIIQRIERYLVKVEAYLISEGEKLFSAEHVDGWLNRLNEARKKAVDEREEETRFAPGFPREQQWIRVKHSTELPIGKLVALATELSLSYKIMADNSLIIYGKEDQIKMAIKRMTVKRRPKTRQHQ